MRNKLKLTKEEIDALKIYEGETCEEGTLGTDRYIYLTINTICFPGVNRELETIYDDNCRLNAQAIRETRALVATSSYLSAAMLKYGLSMKRSINAVRLDTANNFEKVLQKHETISFFSTSKSLLGLIKVKPQNNRKNIVLLNVRILPGTPCVDMKEILGNDYYFSRENEILISPFAHLVANKKDINAFDKRIKDRDKKGLIAKFDVVISKKHKTQLEKNDLKTISQCDEILNDKKIRNNAGKFIELLQENKNKGLSKVENLKSIPEGVTLDYLKWKKAFQNYIKLQYILLEQELWPEKDNIR